jgi:hypothetical protein
MRMLLRVSALLLAVVVLALWFFGGPNLGWTKNSVPHKVRDPVTDIEVDIYEKRWVPGIDFLGAGLVAAGILTGVSLLFGRKTNGVPGKTAASPANS